MKNLSINKTIIIAFTLLCFSLNIRAGFSEYYQPVKQAEKFLSAGKHLMLSIQCGLQNDGLDLDGDDKDEVPLGSPVGDAYLFIVGAALIYGIILSYKRFSKTSLKSNKNE